MYSDGTYNHIYTYWIRLFHSGICTLLSKINMLPRSSKWIFSTIRNACNTYTQINIFFYYNLPAGNKNKHT